MPVPGREIKTNLQAVFSTGINIRLNKIPPTHVLFGANTIFGGPQGITVMVFGGKHGIGETCFLG
ncbi:hypothetical protein SDC9_197481 [bioreactor metagenome]|uniref:Uncharacterized protein n=1 Tax=bioreactor metagenome TaxID=1076179 RepID=A0A645IEZ4_9ZZZZ